MTKNKHKQITERQISLPVWLVAFFIAIITFLVFSPSLKCGFTNWDDDKVVTQNALITSKTIEVKKIFTSVVVQNDYYPITLISLACNYQLGKLDPKGYHLWNVILHILNTMLVFLFVFLLTKRNLLMASIVALFFGIHPMHVESVTWITERKDVLFMFFFMAGLITYLRFRESRKLFWNIFTLVLFILSCLSKGTAVVFPFILLSIDYLLNEKLNRKMILEKIPYLLISVVFVILTYLLHKKGVLQSYVEHKTIVHRIIFASYDLLWYIYKLFIPSSLSTYYSYPPENAIPLVYYLSPFVLTGLIVCIYFFLRKEKSVIFGLLFYFLSIVLMLQFIPTGSGDFNMADRYTYLAYIGLVYVAAFYINKLWVQKNKFRYAIIGITLITASLFCFQTYARTKVWQNSETLWTDAINKNPDESFLYFKRVNYYQTEKNDIDKVLPDYNKALELNPTYIPAYINRGTIFLNQNKFELALADFNKCISLDSANAEAYSNRGLLYNKTGHSDLAMDDYKKSIRLNPTFYLAYFNRGEIYFNRKQYDLAMYDYNKSIELYPTYAAAYSNRGVIYIYRDQYDKALVEFNKAIELNSEEPDYWIKRSMTENTLGKKEEAKADALKAQQLGMNVDADYLKAIGL